MAKQILLVELPNWSEQDLLKVRESYIKYTDGEYHVIVVKSNHDWFHPKLTIVK